MSMKEPFRIMTRSMARTVKAEVPAMYPLKGDHKKPEKSQTGIIEVKNKVKVTYNFTMLINSLMMKLWLKLTM